MEAAFLCLQALPGLLHHVGCKPNQLIGGGKAWGRLLKGLKAQVYVVLQPSPPAYYKPNARISSEHKLNSW